MFLNISQENDTIVVLMKIKKSDSKRKEEAKSEKILTLCIVYQHPKVLLGLKKRGFGVGRWNGFGGKVNPGESVKKAAIREVKEEIGILVKNPEQVGELSFEFINSQKETLKVFVFKATDYEGQIKESEEMAPKWFFIDEVPFKEMWLGDIYWIPIFFTGRKFQGKFVFENENSLLSHSLRVLD